jgi:D-glycero-D-manno-heptose 1,7-bisphosphate phosphatase
MKLFPAVFLDRDGVVNEEMGFLNHIDRFRLIPGAVEGIRKLKEAGFLCVIVTNQPGVALGIFPESLVVQVHERMTSLLDEAGVRLDGIYYCPHHEAAVLASYRCQCPNRKPSTGMIEMAAEDLEIDLSRSYIVGDRGVDIETAGRAGLNSVLVETGYGKGEWLYRSHTWTYYPSRVAKNLKEAATWIVAHQKG